MLLPSSPSLAGLTQRLQVVDCRYCSVINIQSNPAPMVSAHGSQSCNDSSNKCQGPFTTAVTSPVLTVSQVGCMVETTAITRRAYRGDNEQRQAVSTPEARDLARAAESQGNPVSRKLHKRQTDPIIDPTSISVQDYGLIVQISTAIFALDILNSGLNLVLVCEDLRDPTVAPKLATVNVDAVQAADIICWTAQYGIAFNMSITALIQYLADALYAIQLGANYTTNVATICGELNLFYAPDLGIDVDAFYAYICNITAPTTTISSTSTLTVTPGSMWSMPSLTGVSGTGPVETETVASSVAGTAPPGTGMGPWGPTGTGPLGPTGTGWPPTNGSSWNQTGTGWPPTNGSSWNQTYHKPQRHPILPRLPTTNARASAKPPSRVFRFWPW